MSFKPMLASPANFSILRFPLMASVKLDGIRATVHDGVLMSRSMKPIPNKYLQAWCKRNEAVLNGLDGEIIVGNATDEDTFRRTTSFVMSDEKENFEFTYWVFDTHSVHTIYIDRFHSTFMRVILPEIKLLHHQMMHNQEELDTFELRALDEGYEGVMTRDPNGFYKQGRASARSQELLKVKRNEDMEAVIIGYEERNRNDNESFTNELGRTARSSHQANKVGIGTMGALLVRGLNGKYESVEFAVGTGMNDTIRSELWADRENLIGKIVNVKYFPVGGKEKPRHPVYKGIRHPDDMS